MKRRPSTQKGVNLKEIRQMEYLSKVCTHWRSMQYLSREEKLFKIVLKSMWGITVLIRKLVLMMGQSKE